MKIIATNRKATHDYHVIDSIECGIQLIGCEVKSIRGGQVNLKDSYCTIDNGNLVVHSMYVAYYNMGSFSNVDSRRDRRLLAHKSEIDKLLSKVKEKGYTLVPLKMYFSGSLVKVEVGLVKGKQLYDKRDSIAKRDIERDTQREVARYAKGR